MQTIKSLYNSLKMIYTKRRERRKLRKIFWLRRLYKLSLFKKYPINRASSVRRGRRSVKWRLAKGFRSALYKARVLDKLLSNYINTSTTYVIWLPNVTFSAGLLASKHFNAFTVEKIEFEAAPCRFLNSPIFLFTAIFKPFRSLYLRAGLFNYSLLYNTTFEKSVIRGPKGSKLILVSYKSFVKAILTCSNTCHFNLELGTLNTKLFLKSSSTPTSLCQTLLIVRIIRFKTTNIFNTNFKLFSMPKKLRFNWGTLKPFKSYPALLKKQSLLNAGLGCQQSILAYLINVKRWYKNLVLGLNSGVKFIFKDNLILTPNPLSYINLLLSALVSHLFNFKAYIYLVLKPVKYLNILENVSLSHSTDTLRRTGSHFSLFLIIQELVQLVYISSKLRDFSLIMPYIQRLILKLIIWHHRRFFNFVFSIFKEHIFPIFKIMGIVGIYIRLSGKIGVGGDSRKRRKIISLGSTTSSKTIINPYIVNKLWNTRTGALGIKFFIFAN